MKNCVYIFSLLVTTVWAAGCAPPLSCSDFEKARVDFLAAQTAFKDAIKISKNKDQAIKQRDIMNKSCEVFGKAGGETLKCKLGNDLVEKTYIVSKDKDFCEAEVKAANTLISVL